jgi:hypothetical protein
VCVCVCVCVCHSDDVQLYLTDHFDDSYLLLVRIFVKNIIKNVCVLVQSFYVGSC